MELRAPGTPQTETNHRLFCVGAGVLIIAILAVVVDPVRQPFAAVALVVAILILGWLIAASVITHLCGGDSLLCEPPGLHGDFHALSKFLVQLRLFNSSSRWPALFFTVEIEISTGYEILPSPPKFLGCLAPRGEAKFSWEVTARRRGQHELRSACVRACFPGSLVRYKYQFSIGEKLLALPAVYHLGPKVRELLTGRRLAAGRNHFNPSAMEEFIGVRDYRPGDNPRAIHLGLSLRAPDYPYQLVVREFEDPTEDDVCVLLDSALTPEEAGETAFLYRHEKSLSFTAALCRFLAERKYRVRFMCVEADENAFEMMLLRPSSDLPALEARLARLRPVSDRRLVWSLLESQSSRSNSSVLFVSLREIAEEKKHRRLAALTLTPDWQASLVEKVVGL